MTSGITAGLFAADAAHEAAERKSPGWKEDAYHAFKAVGRNLGSFTTEQVRALSPEIRAPRDERAWGGVALRALRDGLIVPDGFVRAQSRSVHGQMVRRWKWKGQA